MTRFANIPVTLRLTGLVVALSLISALVVLALVASADGRTLSSVIGAVGAAAALVMLPSIAGGLLFGRVLSKTLLRQAEMLDHLGLGDGDVSPTDRTGVSEFGAVDRAADALRDRLQQTPAMGPDHLQSEAFEHAPSPLMVTDAAGKIVSTNSAMRAFWSQHRQMLASDGGSMVEDLIGAEIGTLCPGSDLAKLSGAQAETDIIGAGSTVSVTRSAMHGEASGAVWAWRDTTQVQLAKATHDVADKSMALARLDKAGKVVFCNKVLARAMGQSADGAKGKGLLALLRHETGSGALKSVALGKGQAAITSGTFQLQPTTGTPRWFLGGLLPLRDANGVEDGAMFVAADMTDARATNDRSQVVPLAAEASDSKVFEVLHNALKRLAEGDLTTVIEEALDGDHDALRQDFNAATVRLLDAIRQVIDNADTIGGEVNEISRAAEDLSRRTEQQAATLEQTAASLDQLTQSVSSSAEGASKAKNVVDGARANAEKSGEIVQQAVDAMGEISKSSNEISKIIGVIDEIAFQTNLLALNAGVEAARAGDAGRGFAVVASEVRALAQRSSEAAREINDLISVSGSNVGRGVNLVNETGLALREIVTSVGSIADLVAEIAASSQDQSSGLAEINVAVTQLDRVTQQNAAMFEETSAAAATLTQGAERLVSTTSSFNVGTSPGKRAATPQRPAAVVRKPATVPSAKTPPTPKPTPKPAPLPARGNAAPAMALDVLEDNADGWQEF